MPQPFRRKKTQQRGTSLSPEPYTSNPQTNHLTEEQIEELKNLQNLLQQKTNNLTMLLQQNKTFYFQKIRRNFATRKLYLQKIQRNGYLQNTENKNKKLHHKNKKLQRKIQKIPRTSHRERSYTSRSDSIKFETKKYDNQSFPTSTSENSTNSQYSTSQNSQKTKSYDSDTSPSSKHLSNRYSHRRN